MFTELRPSFTFATARLYLSRATVCFMDIISDLGNPVAAFQMGAQGWDATADVSGEKATYDHKVGYWSSLLVKPVQTVPIPLSLRHAPVRIKKAALKGGH
ncbi:MAG: hypothetical protein ABFS24_15730 [Pseudomonadota bacterium]